MHACQVREGKSFARASGVNFRCARNDEFIRSQRTQATCHETSSSHARERTLFSLSTCAGSLEGLAPSRPGISCIIRGNARRHVSARATTVRRSEIENMSSDRLRFVESSELKLFNYRSPVSSIARTFQYWFDSRGWWCNNWLFEIFSRHGCAHFNRNRLLNSKNSYIHMVTKRISTLNEWVKRKIVAGHTMKILL